MSEAAVAEEQTIETPASDLEEQSQAVAGDAGQQETSDAAADAEVSAALEKEAGEAYDAASKEGQTAAPETERRFAPNAEEAQRALNTYKTNTKNRQDAIDAYERELLDADVPQALATRLVKEMKDKVNEQYADGLNYAGYETREAVQIEIADALFAAAPDQEEFAKTLQTVAEKKGYWAYGEAIDFIVQKRIDAELQPGKPRHKAIWEDGFKKARSQASRTSSSANSSEEVSGSSNGAGRRFRTAAEADAAFNNGDIDRATWKSETDRLRG